MMHEAMWGSIMMQSSHNTIVCYTVCVAGISGAWVSGKDRLHHFNESELLLQLQSSQTNC